MRWNPVSVRLVRAGRTTERLVAHRDKPDGGGTCNPVESGKMNDARSESSFLNLHLEITNYQFAIAFIRLRPKSPSSLRVKIAESVERSIEGSALNSRTAVFTRSDEGYFEGNTRLVPAPWLSQQLSQTKLSTHPTLRLNHDHR